MRFIIKNWAITIIIVSSVYLSFNYHKHEGEKIIYADAEGYYMYLPALFIYHGFENIPNISGYHLYEGTNKILTKYNCGVAILELPFFLIAHIAVSIVGGDADGYSYPYRVAILFASLFYLLLSLILLMKVLKRHFSHSVASITLFLIFCGTNLYFYSICAPGMSHIYSFFLFSLILFYTPSAKKNPTFIKVFLISFCIGLITLIRPTNLVILLYPLFYEYKNLKLLTNNFFSKVNFRKYAVSLFAFILPFLPQFIYWKYLSGNYFIYSYKSETFIYWNDPKIWKVLFGVWNGWFIYTPLALVFIFGLLLMLKKNILNARIILIIICISTYVFASWWAWWFGGAFGHRCYVEYYTLLSFSLAFIIEKIFALKSKSLKYFVGCFLLILCYYNLRMTYLYTKPWDGEGWTWKEFSDTILQLI